MNKIFFALFLAILFVSPPLIGSIASQNDFTGLHASYYSSLGFLGIIVIIVVGKITNSSYRERSQSRLMPYLAYGVPTLIVDLLLVAAAR